MPAHQVVQTLTSDPTAFLVDWAPDGGLGPAGFSNPQAASAISLAAVAIPVPVLYLTEPGDTSAISVDDIHQGQIGDCFLLSSIGELALYDPAAISHMIAATGASTEAVTLYATPQGGIPGFSATAFKPIVESVTNSFPADSVDNGATQDVTGNDKEIWPQVLEKAYAQANGGYAGIQNGGNPCIALQELTGHTATWQSPSSATVASLMKDVQAGDLIVMDTGAGNAAYNLVGSHAYMFEGLQTAGGVTSVKLGNPWGFDQPSLIPVAQLSKAIVEVDIGHA